MPMTGRELGTNSKTMCIRKKEGRKKMRRKGKGREEKRTANIKAQLDEENRGRYSSFQHTPEKAMKGDFQKCLKKSIKRMDLS